MLPFVINLRTAFSRSRLTIVSSRRVACSLAFGRLLPAQFRLDEEIDVAVHHRLHVARLGAGAVILHHLIRLKNIRPNLASPCHVPLFSVLPVNLGPLLVLLDLVEFRLEHFHRELAVPPLTPLRLAGNDDSGRLVHDAHRGLNFVHVLAAFATSAEGVDLDIRGIHFDRRGVRDFRDNIDTCEGSVPPLVGVERRNAHEAMHPALGVQDSRRRIRRSRAA